MYLKRAAKSNTAMGHAKSDITCEGKRTLESLQKDCSIIVKEADKIKAIVIMDKLQYRELVLEHLNDQHFYKQLDYNLDNYTLNEISKLTNT